jgi:hypothetical protein
MLLDVRLSSGRTQLGSPFDRQKVALISSSIDQFFSGMEGKKIEVTIF